jgi:ubiquitin-like protein Pup
MTDRDRSRSNDREAEEELEAETAETTDSAAVEGIDDLLDEIDTVLEENAEEFVRNYVQKGGE